MGTHERNRDDQRWTLDGASQTPAAGNLDNLRQAGTDLLNAADELINRALSGTSAEFLAANRQQGGE
jgi:hypothetical protein